MSLTPEQQSQLLTIASTIEQHQSTGESIRTWLHKGDADCLRGVVEHRCVSPHVGKTGELLLHLGQLVTFTHVLTRRRENQRRLWLPKEQRGVGVVVGLRHLQNGTVVYHGYDEPTEWRHEGMVPAVIISTHLRRAPVLCPPEAIT